MLDFEVPFDIDDLVSPGSDENKFKVRKIYKLQEIVQKIDVAKAALNSDMGHIEEHFDIYFSIIKHAEKNDQLILKRVSVLLSLLTERLINLIEVSVFKNANVDAEDRARYCNWTKMVFYLDYEFLKLVNVIQAMDGNSHQSLKSKVTTINWNEIRARFFKQFNVFLKFPVAKLFDNNITDNSFMNMFTDICYRNLAALSGTMSKDIEELVFHILGQSFKRHLHTASYQSQILNILSQNENAVMPIVNGVLILYVDYELKTIFSTIVPEFLNILNVQAKNVSLTKNFSNFLIEIARKAPNIIVDSLEQLQHSMLNMDPYCIRTSILEVMSLIIVDQNVDLMEKAKLELLHELLESVGDGNSYVRSKVFQLLYNVNEKTHFVTQNLIKVLTLAECHLEDKSALVRKNALLLIVELIRSNKSEKKLSIPVLEAELKVEENKLESVMNILYGLNTDLAELEQFLTKEIKHLLAELDEEEMEHDDTSLNSEKIKEMLLREYCNKNYRALVPIVHMVFMRNGDKEEIEKMLPEEREILYRVKCFNMMLSACTPPDMQTEIDTIHERKSEVETAIKYVSIIKLCVEKTKRMLFSTTSSDVLAAIEFFKTGYVFSISIVESGLREMLTLYGKPDANITAIVTQAFIEVLFRNKPQESSEKYYLETCFNMFKLLNDITVGEIIAMEVLINELMRTEIDRELITMLFRIFAKKIGNISDNESRMALELLRMIAKSRPVVMEDNVEVFQTVLLTTTDPRIYATCIEILKYLCSFRNKFAHNIESVLVSTVVRSFKKLFFHPNAIAFDAVAKNVFGLLYSITEYPDQVTESVVLDIYRTMLEVSHKIAATAKDMDMPASQAVSSQSEEGVLLHLPVWLTTRFVHIVGVISMQQVIFLDTAVFNKLQKDAEAKILRHRDDANEKPADDDSLTGARHHRRKSKAAARTATRSGTDNDNETVSERQKIVDEIGESITSVCDLELLYHANAFLGKMVPFVLSVCKRKDTDGRHDQLRAAGVLTLTNLMCVSVKFCEHNFNLAMKILESIEDPNVKLNVIVGFSDWIFQFPNVSEPWTKFIYNMLKSDNDKVRLTTVTILTYLIRQEMVRVRAQISDLALCLVDREERIKEITRQFFAELSEKPQTLESVMPEIISKLNDETQHLPQFQYEEIMTRLFSLITKEKGTLVMVEKLCSRLKESRSDSVAQKCAHCLTLLTHSEKSIRRLIEHLKDLKGKFQIPEVYSAFNQVIAKTTKATGPTLKSVMDELTAKVEDCLKITDDGDEGSAPSTQTQRVQKSQKAKTKGGRAKKQQRISFSDESDTENKPAVRGGGRLTRRNAKNVSNDDSN